MRRAIELCVVFIKVRVMILFDIGHDAFDLLDSFFCNFRFLIPFLCLKEEVFDEHGCLKEDDAYLNGGNLFHVCDVFGQTRQVALENQVPVGELKFAEKHNFGDLFNVFQDRKLEEEFLIRVLFFAFLRTIRVLSYLNQLEADASQKDLSGWQLLALMDRLFIIIAFELLCFFLLSLKVFWRYFGHPFGLPLLDMSDRVLALLSSYCID